MHGHKITNQNNLHFLTLTTVGWIDVFTRSEYRDIVIDSFCFCQHKKGLKLFAYVIMSNHIHLIARAEEQYRLSDIIRDFKKFTAITIIRKIEEEKESRKDWLLMVMKYHANYNKNNRTYQFWQQRNHPIELYSPDFIQQKLDYIHLNPVRAKWVLKKEDYLYSSASNYFNGTGLLEVEILDLPLSNIGYISS
ncbi:MAG: transposase [Bacteroidota bacterium]